MPHSPQFSIVIPARNEERYIRNCLNSIIVQSKSCKHSVEIIVVLNRCTDQTEDIAKEFGAKIVTSDAKNLAAIRNTGLRAAAGEILVTIDADSIMSDNMLDKIAKTMSRGNFVGGGTMIIPERYSLGIVVTGLLIAAVGLFHGISAGLFFCSRQAFEDIGGFDENSSSAEDISFAISLKKYAKKRSMKFKNLLSAHIVTSCRKFDEFGDWYLINKPWETVALLKGKNQKLADKYWYEVKR